MKFARALILAAAVGLAACETTGVVTAPSTPSATIPSTPIDLGNWRSASAPATLQAFEQQVNLRYAAGVSIGAARTDLTRAEFTCGPPNPGDGRGEPPLQVCRRTISASGCTHTWQVHLFGNGDALTRPRGLYDRRCGSDGLLGGPG